MGRKESDKTIYFIENKLFKTFSGYRILELEKFLDCREPVYDWTCVTITEWNPQFLFHWWRRLALKEIKQVAESHPAKD